MEYVFQRKGMMKTMLYDILCDKLNFRNGIVQEQSPEDSNYYQTALDVVWKNDIHFIVVEALFRHNYGYYGVMRNNQNLSQEIYFTKIDTFLFKSMQGIIDDIECGKYNNKKTFSEKIRTFVEQKSLVSYMNNTKWHELFNAIGEKIPDIKLQYKTLFEENAPNEYWEYSGDEELPYMNFVTIEWLKINSIIMNYTHIGILIPPKIQIYDKKQELIKIFEQYHIPYEYNENKHIFITYGYK